MPFQSKIGKHWSTNVYKCLQRTTTSDNGQLCFFQLAHICTVMEVITFESEAYKAMMSKIEQLHQVMIQSQNPVNQFSNEWIDNNDVMKMLGISRRTLCNYIRQGKIKSSRIGKRSYFKVQEVNQMLSEYQLGKTSEK